MKRNSLQVKWAHLRAGCLIGLACLLIASLPASAAAVGGKKSDQQLYDDARKAREGNDFLTAALNLYAYRERQPDLYLKNAKHRSEVDETLRRLIVLVKDDIAVTRAAEKEQCEAAKNRAGFNNQWPMYLPPLPSSCSGRPGPNEVVFFMHFDYQPPCVVKGIGRYDTAEQIGLPNDSISSIRVGGNVRAVLCMHGGSTGTCETFTFDDPNLSDNAIGNDEVTSARIEWR